MTRRNQTNCNRTSHWLRYFFGTYLCFFLWIVSSGQFFQSSQIKEKSDPEEAINIINNYKEKSSVFFYRNKTKPYKNDSINSCNQFFAGISTIFEDSYERFNTFGPTFSFTHPVSSSLGITGDAGIYFGSNNGVNYTKYQLLGGLSLLPSPNPEKVSFSPHLLAGIAAVRSSISSDNFSYSNTSSGFTIAAGTEILFPLNNKISIATKVDYNPTFYQGGIKNNFLIGVGVNIPIGCGKTTSVTPETDLHTTSKKECQASKNTEELKISFAPIEETAKSIEKILNTIPRVEAKVAVKILVAVKQGEECCSKDLPPATYTELKSGVEASCEVNINLWGIPDINYSLKIWPVLLIADFKCKLFAGPTGKANLEGVGKFYGELGKNPRPDCKACFYLTYKLEAYLRIGVKAGGSINIYHWSPFGNGKAGFDVTGEPDEKVEVSAEASVGIGTTGAGTYAFNDECKKPPPGLHGEIKIGKAKANLKFNVKLGPIAFDPNFEFNLFDGFGIAF